MKILNNILLTFLYVTIFLGTITVGLFAIEAFNYYITKTQDSETLRENETRLFLVCLENQSNISKYQSTQIQKLSLEKQEIIERASDLQVENLELRKGVDAAAKIIDYLSRQIEGYKRHLNNGIFEPKIDRET